MTLLQRMDAWWAYRRVRWTYRKLTPLDREALFNPTPETRQKVEAILDGLRERVHRRGL
jgi:hypothetical protein